MTFRIVNGLSFDQAIEMPDGRMIVAADWSKQPSWNVSTSRYFKNHNLFCLDKSGKVIWQVRRDEAEHVGWTKSREEAETRNDNDFWTRSPFTTLRLEFSNGQTNVDLSTHKFPESDRWIEGAKVMCSTLDSRDYEINVETGVARCVDAPTRPW